VVGGCCCDMFVEHLEDSLVKVYNAVKTTPVLGGIVMKTWRRFGVGKGMPVTKVRRIDLTQLKCCL
jgi:hypothetical protein